MGRRETICASALQPACSTREIERRVIAAAAACLLIGLLAGLVLAPAASAGLHYPFIGKFASTVGAGEGNLSHPERVAIDHGTGNVFVSNSGNNRIEVFAPAGETADFLTHIGQGTLSAPAGIAIDQATGHLYVADAGNNRVARFVSDGAAVPTYTIDPGFAGPALAADPEAPGPGEVGSFDSFLAVDPLSGDLLIADTGADIVQRYDDTGSFVDSFDGSANGGTAFTGLLDIAVDSTGEILVVDSEVGTTRSITEKMPSEVRRYTGSGDYVATLPQILSPGVVAIDPSDDSVLVAGNFQSYFDNGPPLLGIYGSDDTLTAEIPLSAIAQWSITAGLAATETGRIFVVSDLDPIDYNWGTVGGFIFGPSTFLPTIGNATVGDATRTTATLSGTVDPDGGPAITACKFVFNDGLAPQDIPCDPAPPISTATQVTADLSGLKAQTEYNFYLQISNPNGLVVKTDQQSFMTDSAVGGVTTTAASDIAPGAATLNGSIDLNGENTTYVFEYGLTAEYDHSTLAAEAGPGTGTTPVAAAISGLEPYKTYHYRLVATNPVGTSVGADMTIRSSPPQLPELGATTATDVTPSSAILRSAISPGFGRTVYRFQYGTTPDLGQNTPTSEPIAADDSLHPVFEPISGLSPATTYYYRVVATNFAGAVRSPVQSFSTPAFPTVLAASVSEVTQTSARLNATIRPGLAATTYRFEYGRDTSYGSSTAIAGPTAADVDEQVSAVVTGLEPGVTYHFRVVATNLVGTAFDDDRSFTTAPAPKQATERRCGKGKVRKNGKCVKKKKKAKKQKKNRKKGGRKNG